MVTNNPISICWWSCFLVRTWFFSLHDVVKSLEKTFAQVHISNWIYAIWEFDWARILSISVTPMMFNTFQMPLVHQNNNFLPTWSINLFKKILIFLINKYSLKVREESCYSLCVPVYLMLIETFLSKGWRTYKTQCVVIFFIFLDPLCLSPLKSLNNIINCV